MKQRCKSLCISIPLSIIIHNRKTAFAVPFPFTNSYWTFSTSGRILFLIRFRMILKTIFPSRRRTHILLYLLYSNPPGFSDIVTQVENCMRVGIYPVSYILLVCCTSTSHLHSSNPCTIFAAHPLRSLSLSSFVSWLLPFWISV